MRKHEKLARAKAELAQGDLPYLSCFGVLLILALVWLSMMGRLGVFN